MKSTLSIAKGKEECACTLIQGRMAPKGGNSIAELSTFILQTQFDPMSDGNVVTSFSLFRHFVCVVAAFFLMIGSSRAQTAVSASFKTSSAPGWEFGGSNFTPFLTAGSVDSSTNGWLRLTDTNFNESVYARYTNSIPSTNSTIYASFDLADWNGNGIGVGPADGLTFFLYDASQTFAVGGYGGSLGYAQRTGINGMNGGYLGIGFDEYGNYSNPTEDRTGGPGFLPVAIAVRGSGSGTNGYVYLSGTGDGINPMLPQAFNFPNATTRPTVTSNSVHIELVLSPQNILVVYIQYGTNSLKTYFTANLSPYARPANMSFGYTASTGGGAAFHEIRNFTIVSFSATLWDNDYGTGFWGDVSLPNNWHPNAIPSTGADILLDNTYVSSAQTIDLQGQTETIRSISFDAPFSYTLTNGTLTFTTNSFTLGHPQIDATSGNGSSVDYIYANIVMNDQLTIDNANVLPLYINGNVTNNGNDLYIGGGGITYLNGQIVGKDNLTLLPGTLEIGASDRIDNKLTLNLNGGTLNLNNFSEGVTNLYYNNGSIDYGTGANSNYFMFGSGVSSSNGLTILDWQPGDALAFSNSIPTGFLDGIYFEGYGPAALIISNQTIPGYSGTWNFIVPATNNTGWFTWNGANNNDNWSSRKNWVGNSVNPVNNGSASTNQVSFEGTTRLTPNLDSSIGVNTVRFNTNAGAFVLMSSGNNTLTLQGILPSILQLSSTNEVISNSMPLSFSARTITDVKGTGTLTIQSQISGNGGLDKLSSGTLIVTNNNTYSGFNQLEAGTVRISNGGALGTATANSTIFSGATLEVTNNISVSLPWVINGTGVNSVGAIRSIGGSNHFTGSITIGTDSRIGSDNGQLIIDGSVSGPNNLYVGGTNGTLTFSNSLVLGLAGVIKDGTNTVTFAGSSPNSYATMTTVNAGVLALNKTAGVNAIAGGLTIGDGSGSDMVRLLNNDQISDSSAVTILSSGVLDLNNFSDTIGSLSSTTALASVTLGSGTLTISDATNTSFSGVISGTGNLVKTGSATQTLAGSSVNTYSGNTLISGGTLILSKTTSNAIAGGTVTIASGTLQYAANDQISNAVNVVLGGGACNVGSYTDVVGTLKVTNNSAIVFTTNGFGSISFAASLITTWSNGYTLYVSNWTDNGTSADVLKVGSNASGLGTGGPIFSQIQFVNPNGLNMTVSGYIRTDGVVVPAIPDFAPVLSAIAAVTNLENSSAQTINLSGIAAGSVSERLLSSPFSSQIVTNITATSGNTSLILNPTVTYTNGSTTATLTYNIVPNTYGTTVVSVVEIDNGLVAGVGGTNASTNTFTVSVPEVNQAPTFTVPVASTNVLENAGIVNITLTGITTGPGETSAGQSITNFTAVSSNTNLIINPTISYTSGNSTAVLSFTTVNNVYGTNAIITIVAQDNGGTANSGVNATTNTIVVTVQEVNQPPTFGGPSSTNIVENAGSISITLTNVSTGLGEGSAGQSITNFVATSGNTNLIINPAISFTNGNSTAVLTFGTVSNAYGSNVVITIVAKDNGGTANGGISATTNAITVNLQEVNQAPTFTLPVASTNVLENAGSISLTISGISTGAGEGSAGQSITNFTVTSSDTSLVQNPTINFTNGNTTAVLTFGTVSNAYGSNVVLTVIATDNGGTANGAFNSTTNNITVSVREVNQPPTFTVPVASTNIFENASAVTITLTGVSTGPGEGSAGQSITNFTAVSSNTNVVNNPSLTYSSGNTATLSFIPVNNSYGSNVVITLVAKDNGGTANGGISATTNAITVNVQEVNQRPTYTLVANTNILENAGTVTVSLTGIGTGLGEGSAGQGITNFTAVSSDSSIVVNPTVLYTNGNTTGTLTFNTVSNAYGSNVVITLVATDDGGTANGGINATTNVLTVNVQEVNRPPTFTLPVSSTNLLQNAGTITMTLTGVSTGLGESSAGQSITNFIAKSSNTSLIANPTITYNSGDSTAVMTFSPVANAYGSNVVITVCAKDNGGTANGGISATTNTFTVNVQEVNQPPTFTLPIANTNIVENSGTVTITLTGVSTGLGETSAGQSITNFVAISSNTNFINNPTINYTAGASTATLTVTPVSNAYGSNAVITIIATDNGGTTAGGINSTTNTLGINIREVNLPPTFALTVSSTNLLENAGIITVAITNVSTGLGEGSAGQAITNFFAISGNTNLIINPTIGYTNGNDTAMLTFQAVSNVFGSNVVITVVAQDDGGGTAHATTNTVTVNIAWVNQPPTFGLPITTTNLLENAGTVNVVLTNVGTGLGDGPLGQLITNFVAISSDTSLIPNPTISYTNGNTTAILSFTPQNNTYGSNAVITIVAQDNGGTANGALNATTNTLTVNVGFVNQTPTLGAISNLTIKEDAGPQTVNLSGISAGPASESSQTVTVTATSDNTSLIPNPFVTYTSGDTTGALAFTPVANGNGTATITVVVHDDGGTANGSIDSVTNTFMVTVNSVNDAPTLNAISNLTINEDAGLQTITLTGISTGAANEGSQSITNFVAISSNTNLIANPTILYTNGNSTALLQFTALTNANGSATVTVILQDNGGVANGGVNGTTNLFTLTVTQVNDAPSFVKGTNVILRTTTSAQTFPNWATAISAGPADEASQTLSFHLSSDNAAMFSVQPAISANGALTFTPGTNGTAHVTVYLQDDGGTANGGVDTSASQTFTIAVAPINVAPSFTFASGTNISVLEDTTNQTVLNWVTNISAGSPDEIFQTVNFVLTNDNTTMFSVQPAISTNGTLTYTLATNANGTANVSVVLHDDGGTDLGGVDTSAPQIFTISTTPVNDPPSFTKGLDVSVGFSSSRAQTILNWATAIVPGPADESSQTVTFIVTNDNPTMFIQQPTVSANGTLAFEVIPDATNTVANVSVQLKDDGGTANGGVDISGVQTFQIALSSSFTTPTTISSGGRGPTGLYLGNLRGLTYRGATRMSGYHWRDLIIANYVDNTVSIRFCNDDGTFTAPITYPVGLNPFGVMSGDFHKTGFEDVVVANFGTNTISILKDNANRTFAPAVDYVIGSTPNPGPISIRVDDLNGDGRLDIIVANYNENTVSVLKGLGAGIFAAAVNYPVGRGPMTVMTGDFNGDGVADIVTANKDDGTLSILLGRGDGTFNAAQTVTLFAGGDPQPAYVFPRDLNGDGIMDLVTANYNSNSISILVGQGDGTFQLKANYTVGVNPRSVLVRDLDHDGIVDIAVANSGSGTLSVLKNHGDASFEPAGIFGIGSQPLIVWGSNFNNDDATDLAVSNFGDNTISILRYAGPLAYNFSVNAFEDTPTNIVLRANSSSGATLDFNILTPPVHGTISGSSSNLVYTPAANYVGPDSFRYQTLAVSGSAILDSSAATVSITVNPINDPPSFGMVTNLLASTNFGILQTITNFATNISMGGGSDETNQHAVFSIVSSDRTFFDIQPLIATNGTLTFRAAATKSGTNYLTIRLKDNGGVKYGGNDTSPAQILTIVVAPNPYAQLKGTYNGLFYESSQVKHVSSGYFTMTVTDRRIVTGKLTSAGTVYALGGQFGTDGTVQITVPRAGKTSLAVSLQFDFASLGANQVHGSVSDGTWTASLLGDKAVFNALTNASPLAGKYTMVFPGGTNSTSPAGNGFGTLTVKPDGTVVLAGTLADSTAVAQSTTISGNGHWPFYASLYGAKGSILGWINFADTADTSFTGDVIWMNPGLPTSKYYPHGFTNAIEVAGSAYVTPAAGTAALALTNLIAQFSYGNLSTTLSNSISLGGNNVYLYHSGSSDSLTLTNTLTTGLISGSIINPANRAKLLIKGVLFQKQSGAFGFSLGTNQTSLFLLEPQP